MTITLQILQRIRDGGYIYIRYCIANDTVNIIYEGDVVKQKAVGTDKQEKEGKKSD